jgi:hypothetical protein
MLAEKNDVSLVALLGSLSRSVRDMREVGRKFSVCQFSHLYSRLTIILTEHTDRRRSEGGRYRSRRGWNVGLIPELWRGRSYY